MATKSGKQSSKRPSAASRASSDTARDSGSAGKPDPQALEALQKTVVSLGTRLHRAKVLRPGAVVFRTPGEDGTSFTLRATATGVQIERTGEPTDSHLEVIGDPRRIHAILRGEKEGRLHFLAGGLRVRGDMHYLSQLGVELGFLAKPIA
jgi:hypothetical protein